MTLTDFLLARIAEDEAWNHQNHGGDPSRPGSITRVKAECEAKRRIVEEWLTFKKVSDARADDTPLPQALTQAGIVVGLERAARALAVPYADHPDYREEWKP